MEFYAKTAGRTFSNGLRVFVSPQPGRAVEVECFVQTGSIHEGEYLGCGLSHFLEHMLFQGCRNYPGTAAADTIDRLGGSMNAYTSFDHTAYHANLAGVHLEEAIDVLASMVRYPDFPEERFASEREVILRERELGVDNPDRRLSEALIAEIYRKHPVRCPIIGKRELIATVTRDRMSDYYQRRYTPGRTFWVVVGDVEPERVFDLVEARMGDWPAAHLDEVILPPEPRQFAMRRNEFVFKDPLARLGLGFQLPPISDEDIPALDILSGILGMGDGSRLVRVLELEKQLSINLRSFCYTQPAGGIFGIVAGAIPGKLDHLDSALRTELENIRKNGFSSAEVRREKTQQLAEHLRELRNIREIASNIGGGIIAGDTPALSDLYMDRLSALTLDDINRAAAKYLRPDAFSLVRQLPEATRTAMVVTGKHFDLVPETAILKNGSRLVTVCDRRLPLVDLAVSLPGGTIFEPASIGGISGLVADLLVAGAGRYSESELLNRFDGCGADFSVDAGLNSFILRLNVPRRGLPQALRLLEAILSAPRFGNAEFEREKASRRELLKSRAQSPRARARDKVRELLYGSHPYGWGNSGSLAQLEATTREDVVNFFRSRWSPSQLVFGIGGDCTAAEAEKWAGRLSDAVGRSEPFVALPPPPVFPNRPCFARIELPREQTAVLHAVPGPALMGTLLSDCEILHQAENGLSSHLFKRVREDNALAYTTGMQLSGGFHPGAFLFYAVTSAENADLATDLLRQEVVYLAENGISEAVFNAAREGAAFNAARAAESASAALASAVLSLHYNRSAEEVWKHEEELRNRERDAVNAALRPYLSNPNTATVLAGR